MSDTRPSSHEARVFWITGLSGSGKSTIAEHLDAWLHDRGQFPIMLDGDAIRDMILEPLGHDLKSRLKVAKFNARLCRFLVLQGKSVICPTISLFHEIQEWNRENIHGYIEIFVDTPLDVIRIRDPKGLYKAYDQGKMREIVGLDLKAEYPKNPDLTIKTSKNVTVHESAKQLFDFIERLLNGKR